MECKVAKTVYKKRFRNGEVKEAVRSHKDLSVRMGAFRVTPETAEKIEAAVKERGINYSELLRQMCEVSFS